ncbi:MAG: O-antigen ligase family protein [Patescibacteria group bacterium]
MNFSKKLDFVAFSLVAILFTFLPFHAFLWTWFHAHFWTDSWTIVVQSWKEILVGLIAILAAVKLIFMRKLPRDRTFWLGTIFVILALFYLFLGGISEQKILGLRTATLFLIAFLAVQFFDFGTRARALFRVILFSGGVVILFALAQKFLLPADFLRNFGYSENVSSWLPGGNLPMFHLLGNSETIRLQSTFAGPNQLAAFLLVLLPIAFFEFWRGKKLVKYFLAAEILGGILVLIFTFSRSAWLGAAAIFLIFAVEMWRKNLPAKLRQRLFLGGILAILGCGILFFASENRSEIFARLGSTSEHFAKSLAAGELVLQNPFGLGLGQTAGVSQRFGAGITPENTFLGVALELGWLGGILFLVFCGELLHKLKNADSPLFYSLVGILVVAFFLHPLEDAPTALTLFLLAGIKVDSSSSDH